MSVTPSARPWPNAGVALLEREVTLPPDSDSPRAARRVVRATIADAGEASWLDAAELAVSEVVTNVVLHAHTTIDLAVVVYPERFCVEVRDRNPVTPTARGYDNEASTGRGMALVAAVTTACGVHSLGPDGKVIWFCIGGTPDESASGDLIDAWALDDELARPASLPTNVVLAGMPATLWLSARQHHDALLRELTLYAANHDLAVDFAAADRARWCISDAVDRAVDAAHERGETRPPLPVGHPSPLPWVPQRLDLELSICDDDRPMFMALPDALDLAERLAVSGELLLLPGLPEIIAVRDWACEQVTAQLAGSPPVAWPGTARDHFETETHGREMVDGSVTAVSVARESDEGVVAADEANRIVAISRRLAAALGWIPDDLVGRRVVTLIPPHLREAHVAGFSRHLSTGEAHVLGVELELPVLHHDGSEITCRFMIERTGGAGAAVYLAWIEPVELQRAEPS